MVAQNKMKSICGGHKMGLQLMQLHTKNTFIHFHEPPCLRHSHSIPPNMWSPNEKRAEKFGPGGCRSAVDKDIAQANEGLQQNKENDAHGCDHDMEDSVKAMIKNIRCGRTRWADVEETEDQEVFVQCQVADPLQQVAALSNSTEDDANLHGDSSKSIMPTVSTPEIRPQKTPANLTAPLTLPSPGTPSPQKAFAPTTPVEFNFEHDFASQTVFHSCEFDFNQVIGDGPQAGLRVTLRAKFPNAAEVVCHMFADGNKFSSDNSKKNKNKQVVLVPKQDSIDAQAQELPLQFTLFAKHTHLKGKGGQSWSGAKGKGHVDIKWTKGPPEAGKFSLLLRSGGRLEEIADNQE